MSRTRRDHHVVSYSRTKSRRNFRAIVRAANAIDWPVGQVIRDNAGRDREWPPVPLKPAHRRKRRRAS